MIDCEQQQFTSDHKRFSLVPERCTQSTKNKVDLKKCSKCFVNFAHIYTHTLLGTPIQVLINTSNQAIQTAAACI